MAEMRAVHSKLVIRSLPYFVTSQAFQHIVPPVSLVNYAPLPIPIQPVPIFLYRRRLSSKAVTCLFFTLRLPKQVLRKI